VKKERKTKNQKKKINLFLNQTLPVQTMTGKIICLANWKRKMMSNLSIAEI
jgi:hypothetical protein